MTLNRFVFKTHKWLAVTTLLASLFWFASGVVMVTPQRFLGNRYYPERPQPGDQSVSDATVDIRDALRVAQQSAGGSAKLTDARLRLLAGRATYEISVAGAAPVLVDATSGTRVTIDADFARRTVQRFVSVPASSQVTLLQQHTGEYDWGPLPAWRIPLGDSRETLFFVGAERGEVSSSDRYGRIRGWIIGFHSFAFLKAWFSTETVRRIMWVFSVVGTLMILFGCWILWLQWKIWTAGRKARAASA